MAETRMPVNGPSPYDVVVGHGVLDEVAAMLGPDVERVAVIHPASQPDVAERLVKSLTDVTVLPLGLPDGEAAKTVAVAARCWEALGEVGFTRSDAIVTVGGGATTDLGGFVAATWLRGVRVVHVPTTLLGMVDAAVGGKTGINTAAGKNLVGSFHEPAGVVCDLDSLASLPSAELVSGLAEVVKCGFIADPRILDLVEEDPADARDPGSARLRELVERAIAVKVAVVTEDLRETGGVNGRPGREVLNYGHTFGHAVERVTSYGVRHGEAVALGMVFVAELARLAGVLGDGDAARHAAVLDLVGLPTSRPGLDFASLLAAMRVDKKARGSHLRFVVLEGIGRPRVLTDPPEDRLRAAYDKVGAR